MRRVSALLAVLFDVAKLVALVTSLSIIWRHHVCYGSDTTMTVPSAVCRVPRSTVHIRIMLECARKICYPCLSQMIFATPIQTSIHRASRFWRHPLADILKHEVIGEVCCSRYRDQILILINSGSVSRLPCLHQSRCLVNGYFLLVQLKHLVH